MHAPLSDSFGPRADERQPPVEALARLWLVL